MNISPVKVIHRYTDRELFDLPFIDRLDQTALIFFPWTPSFNYCLLSQAIVRGYTACLRVKALLRRNSYWKLQKAFICSCNPMHSLMAILFCSSTIKSQSLQSSSVPTEINKDWTITQINDCWWCVFLREGSSRTGLNSKESYGTLHTR